MPSESIEPNKDTSGRFYNSMDKLIAKILLKSMDLDLGTK